MRVLRVLTRPNLGGPTRQAIALWHAHRDLGVQTLLATGAVDRSEAMLSPAAGGVPALSFDRALAAGAAASGWVEVPGLVRGASPFGDARARRALRALLRALRPDVVHTHTTKAGWVGRRAAFAERIPVVAHTFHGHVLQDYFAPPVAWALRWLERRLAARTDLLFAVSDSCADELAAAGIAARARFRVVPPAVPEVPVLARAAARERLGVAAGELRLACVGRLVPIKRVEHFVQLLAQLPHAGGDIVGDGPQRAQLAALAERLAPGRVHLRGAVPDIAGLLAAYDALVLPSVREGCPLVAVEAFAAGVPVVGYDVPGVRDMLATWGGGVLVPAAAGPAGLLAALQRLLASPLAPAGWIAAGQRVRAAFAPRAVAEALLAAYRPARDAAVRYDAEPPA